MKIAIIGTRGIPNNYGGFEQFAEQLSIRLAVLGHDVTVFNPSYHKYSENTYKNVRIVRIPCYENFFGGAAHFFYDYNCYKDAIKHQADIALICGYGTSAPAMTLLNKGKTKMITNMDGFEWKRAKYNFITKILLKWFEKITVLRSDKLIADHPVIQNYFQKKYNVIPALISYGAVIPSIYDETTIFPYGLTKGKYFLVIARDEPENQIELIISSWKNSASIYNLCIVTNYPQLSKKYANQNGIIFITGLYDFVRLSNLRHFSLACIHGHTVGGTNPSLLEGMAAQSNIIAHDNSFHRDILENNAMYFDSENSLSVILQNFSDKSEKTENSILKNLCKIRENYMWEQVTMQYLELFKIALKNKNV